MQRSFERLVQMHGPLAIREVDADNRIMHCTTQAGVSVTFDAMKAEALEALESDVELVRFMSTMIKEVNYPETPTSAMSLTYREPLSALCRRAPDLQQLGRQLAGGGDAGVEEGLAAPLCQQLLLRREDGARQASDELCSTPLSRNSWPTSL